MKILVLALSGIGDALMFTPALKALKENEPKAKIDVLAMIRGVKDIYERVEFVDEVIYFDFMKEGLFNSLKFLRKLRKNKYDASISVYPSNRKEYNVINFLVGAKQRAAVRYKRMDFQNLGFLNNVRIAESDERHNVEHNIHLCSKLIGREISERPDLIFPLSHRDKETSKKFLEVNGLREEDLVIGFHPGCSILKNHINRRWEPAKFAKLGDKLIKEFDAKILIFGGPEEELLKRSVVSMMEDKNAITVETSNLAESAAIIKRCDLFVTNDSSLMHVASAMKRKTLAIIGPTNINYIYPWNTDYKIASLSLECAPCFFYSPKPLICKREDVQFKCVRELEVNDAFSKIKDFIKAKNN